MAAGDEWRWLASEDVLEEAGAAARKDVIDVAGETVPDEEQVRGELATASKRRPKDTACAFIVLACRSMARTVLCSAVSRQMPLQRLPDTNRVSSRQWVRACPPASFSSSPAYTTDRPWLEPGRTWVAKHGAKKSTLQPTMVLCSGIGRVSTEYLEVFCSLTYWPIGTVAR